jgi:transcriptional regulator with XRE-family HTH domain
MDPYRLDRELARRGWNATDLAKASGISVGTISAARQGRPVSNATLSKIAEALHAAPIVKGIDVLLDQDGEITANGSEPVS